nr:type II CRISPR-associated endonuclease Cas1 [uncultured Niameybacter sp.]
MSWRTVVITNHVKLSYKNGYMVIKGTENNLVHLSEIGTLLVDSTMANISSHLICELLKRKVKIIFCDEKRNPMSEVVPYYGCHNSSKKIMQQIQWNKYFQQLVWTQVIKQKILNQASLLEKKGLEKHQMLKEYTSEIEFFDATNREGHAAKVYFNSLFGMDFTRDDGSDINVGLDYGYAILLSTFNKEIVNNGYLTQLGIKHTNIFNPFNLSSDLMEPFRILVDQTVYDNQTLEFGQDFKMKLVDILNQKVYMDGKEYYVGSAIQIYLKSIFETIESQNLDGLQLYEFI